ncbi:MAG: type II toxin-antitoxin system HicA family toxin [Ignavibacteriae bacterium]|nr:type II toxin-antitoxin system HicA family toxin [Ignavibacteriota bacterium]
MGKLKVLSGEEVCKILILYGFEQVRQKGSHIIMQKKFENTSITVPVPNHRELMTGTIKSIIKQSGLPKELFEN